MGARGLIFGVMMGCSLTAFGQGAETAAPVTATPVTVIPVQAGAVQASAAASVVGGTIQGTVKAGAVPLPGVAVTATNTLTGKKYATSTDVNGAYAMTIPRAGRYVVRAELAAFATATSEVKITAEATAQTAVFTLELASRVTQAAAAGEKAMGDVATALLRGTQSLSSGIQSLNVSGDSSVSDASVAGGGNTGASLPSMGGLGGDAGGGGGDSVAVSGQLGQTNALGNLSEDQIRQRIEDAVAQARQQGGGGNNGDPMSAVAQVLGGILGGGGLGGGGGGGGRGGGGGFARFNPTQPHGAVFYQGGFSALDAQPFSLTGAPTVKQSSYQNRYGVSFTGSPSIPGFVKASNKQFVFLSVTGSRNINPLNLYGNVPTALERLGDFSQTQQLVNGSPMPVTIYDPSTGLPFSGTGKMIPQAALTPQALALLNYYPLPNVLNDPTRNLQTITTQGQNSFIAASRFVRNFGAGGLSAFGGGGAGGAGGVRGQKNAPLTLRQNVNAGFNYSHTAGDLRNIIPLLGGKTLNDGYSVSAGYTVGYGRLNNNSTVTWNRSHARTTNYFTGLALNPAVAAGVFVPSQGATIAQGGFYNGVPNIQLTSYTSLSEQQPRDGINQTVSFSDFVSYSHKKHNMRFGGDLRRVHADQVGGNNVVGSFIFSGLVTQSPADQAATLNNNGGNGGGITRQASTGSALADFLIGQPQETKIQAGLYKTYLRETVYDFFAQDDFRVTSGVTLNYGLRYEYFAPYVEKNNRLVNLDHNADFTVVQPVLAGGTGSLNGGYPRSLVNPDRTMFSPRFGFAWRPKFLKQTVLRGGYGLNYNTGQYGTFAQSLAFQPPFATTQNNTLSTKSNQTGCNITQPGAPTNLTLANGFACATKAIQNNYAVNRDYRLGHVQVFNLDVQKSLPHGVVVNAGYNGSRGGNLDIVRAPNATATAVTTANAQAFTYEDSVAESRLNQFVVSARKRLEKGLAVQATYEYGHSIDNASSIGGSSTSQVQNDKRLDLEEGNSSFDVRHKLTGNFVLELPFGPNRAFLNKGGVASKILDGFGLNGDFTFATGTYSTPHYSNTAAQLAAGGTYTLRPDRVFSQPLAGPGTKGQWFNKAAFAAPANGFGTASRNSIEGPGTVSFNLSLGRTVALGSTRSFEGRLATTNVFNTVQYSSIDTTVNSPTFGQVTGTAGQRRVTLIARYRF